MSTIYKCDRCGEEFYSKGYTGGLIDHENWTSDHNLKAGMNRNGIDGMIKSFDMRYGNYCNIKDYDKSEQKDLVNCALIWLEQNGYTEEKEKMINYFKDKEILFNKIFEGQEEFKKEFNFYVVDQNCIIDFYNENELEGKEYKFIKINDESNSKTGYHIGIIYNDTYTILKSR